MKVPSKFDNKN